MTKYFVLRPHAILSSYDSLHRFGEDNVVVVPLAVIDEINAMHDLSPEKSKIRKAALKYIRSLMDKGVTSENGYKLEEGGTIRVVSNYADVKIDVPNISEFQRRTLQVCIGIQNEGKNVILVTNNMGLQIKAHMAGITAEEFKDEIFPVLEEQYKGRINVEVSAELATKLYNESIQESVTEMFTERSIDRGDLEKETNYELLENEYVIMTYGEKSYYGQVKDDKIVLLNAHMREPYGIKPMNTGQKLLMNALCDNTPLVVVKGPPGTGKTLLSMAVALDRVVEKHEFSRILITRSVSNDKLGYLPGSVDEKLSPFLQGVTDNLDVLINGTNSRKTKKLVSKCDSNSKNKLEKNKNKYVDDCEDDEGKSYNSIERGEYLFEKGIIKIQALEMIRGRSIVDTIFIIDETQNIEPEFAKTIVSRAAKGSKFIFLGDPSQIDNPKLSDRYNALVYLAEKLKGDVDCTVVSLEDEESVRSRLARIATQIL